MWDDHSRYWSTASIPGDEDKRSWELFHEDSKVTPYSRFPPPEQVIAITKTFHESLPYVGYPEVALPQPSQRADADAFEVMRGRHNPLRIVAEPISLQALADIAYHAYGVNRIPVNTPDCVDPAAGQRRFRTVPSGGALYPLEVFFGAWSVNDLEPGLYHYHPVEHRLTRLDGAHSHSRLTECFVQREEVAAAPVTMMICAHFERSVFKYGPRGYRFTLLEAGHVMQNAALASVAHGLGLRPLGAYFDRQLDNELSFDGLKHSTLYCAMLGKEAL